MKLFTGRKGFSLIEVALTIGLLTIIGAALFLFVISLFRLHTFEEKTDAIASALITARDQSIAGKHGATFGVKFLPDSYVIFEGTSYATRVPTEDEVFPLPANMEINQGEEYPDEIAFTESGEITTGLTTTVKIEQGDLLRTIIFNEFGAETVTPVIDIKNPPPESIGTLEAYWKMNETSGTRYDSAGSFDLVKRDMDLGSGAGKIGNAGQLGGYGQIRNIDGEIGNANRDFTVAGWFNILGTNQSAYLISGIVDQTDSLTWIIHYNVELNRFQFILNGINDVTLSANSFGAPDLGTWYFVAASYNAKTKQASIRVNNGAPDTITSSGTPLNGAGVLVGGAGYARVDEVGIWTKVLTDAELATLYNEGAGTTTPFTGTLGVKTGPFAAGTPTDLPPVDCGWFTSERFVYPTYVENATTTLSTPLWSSSTAALAIDNAGTIVTNNGSTPTLSRTLQFRNLKSLAGEKILNTMGGPPYGISKIAIDLYSLGGINVQDSTMRIIRPGPTSTINMAKGTSMKSAKVIRYEGETTNDWWGWRFGFNNDDANALFRDDTSFGFDFDAKLNGASSTATIDGAKITVCQPFHVDCFGDPKCLEQFMSDGSEGPLITGMFTNDYSIGSSAWGSTSNAGSSDNVYTTTGVSTTGASNYLKGMGFNFTIPTSAIIKGIVVEWERSRPIIIPPPPPMPNTMDGIPADNAVRLVKGGVISGDDKSKPDQWGTSDAVVSYGSPTDLWGLSWVPADFNGPPNTNFGIAISAKKVAGGVNSAAIAQIDNGRITVYYKYLAGASLYDITIDYIKNLFK